MKSKQFDRETARRAAQVAERLIADVDELRDEPRPEPTERMRRYADCTAEALSTLLWACTADNFRSLRNIAEVYAEASKQGEEAKRGNISAVHQFMELMAVTLSNFDEIAAMADVCDIIAEQNITDV